jgi:secreted Zn-dependent insulinase-like peptidase
MISRPLGQEFYFRMRTRQQLGYIVWSGMGQMRKTLHLNFLVQSGQYPADELIRRMEAFIPGFIRYFQALTTEQFETYRTAVIKAKLERDKSLGDIANRLFWMAFRNDERFDYVSRDIAAVEALQRGNVEAVLKRYLAGEGRKRLVIRLLGKTHAAGAPKGQKVTLPNSVMPKAG